MSNRLPARSEHVKRGPKKAARTQDKAFAGPKCADDPMHLAPEPPEHPLAQDIEALLAEVKDIRRRLDTMPRSWGASVRHYRQQAVQQTLRTVRRLHRAARRRTASLVATDVSTHGSTNAVQRKQATIYAPDGSPSLYVQAPPGGFVYGWVRLTLKFDIASGSGAVRLRQAHLVADVGRGFDSGSVQTLRLVDSSGSDQNHHIVFLPPGLESLRLDLPNVPARSTIDVLVFTATEIIKQEATISGVVQHLPSWRADPKSLARKGVRLAHYLRHHGLGATLERLGKGPNNWVSNYQEWAAYHATLTPSDMAAIGAHIRDLRRRPTFSIVMPVYNPPEEALRAAIASVQGQLYPHWQFCIVDDASTLPHVAQVLTEAERSDARIHVHRRRENGHICRASNDGLEMAQGEYVVLFDHDDLLAAHALYMLAHELDLHPEAQIIYSDEDKVTEAGDRYHPYFKHQFDPDLLLGQNCISHLGCYSAARLRTIGGFREGFEGSQDHDLVLRAASGLAPKQIRHIPHVLYHWRAVQGSTAAGAQAKPYAHDAGIKAVQDHLHREGIKATACATANPGLYRIKYAPPKAWPKVSVIIPTRDRVDLLRQCITSLQQNTKYGPLEIIVVDNDSTCKSTISYLDTLRDQPGMMVLDAPGPFNFAAINNRAVEQASGDVICLLNNDIEAMEPGWLQEMVSHAVRPGIGVVGARLLYPDAQTIQHAGVILGLGGIASHAFQRETLTTADHFGHDRLVRRYSAVTGACLVVSKSIWDEVGGLDPALKVAYNDIDFCLKVGALGYAVVWTPFATLLHHESASRGSDTSPEKAQRFMAEQAHMLKKWDGLIDADPYYNPNLTLNAGDFSLSIAPRVGKPWHAYLQQTAAHSSRQQPKPGA